MTALSTILTHKIVAIIRGANPPDVIKIATALKKGGIRIMEITLNSPNALSAIKNLVAELGDGMLIGAGTVLDAVAAKNAISAGAKFIISPIVDVNTIKITKELGVVSIPGAYTPTEIVYAYNHGADIIKVFPASSGADFIKDIRGPLSHIPLMPTGGVNLQNIHEYQKAGSVAFGIGSALVDTNQDITDNYLYELTEKARRFVKAIEL